jgi:uncharacterized membrane protein
MRYGWHVGGGWLFLLLVLALVGVVVYLVSREVTLHRLTHQPPAAPQPGPYVALPPARVEPLDILRERYALGDITLDEFETAMRALGYPSSQPPPPAPPTG